jgi:hypothetical protein
MQLGRRHSRSDRKILTGSYAGSKQLLRGRKQQQNGSGSEQYAGSKQLLRGRKQQQNGSGSEQLGIKQQENTQRIWISQLWI